MKPRAKKPPVVDENPDNTGVVVWRDEGRARGRLTRVEVHQDERDAATRVQTHRFLRGRPEGVKMHRREVRVDGARCVVYFVVVREKEKT